MTEALTPETAPTREPIAEWITNFAFLPRSNYEYLKELAADENWGANGSILLNYIAYLYREISAAYNDGAAAADTIIITDEYACFNTGLYTDNYEDIYAYFVPNLQEDKQPWFLNGFYPESDSHLQDIPVLPRKPILYDEPADLIFDHRLPIRVNIDHILEDEDNFGRLPEALQRPEAQKMLPRLFKGAVDEAQKRVSANYTLAVPQCYNGEIQLLIPLCLTGDEPELALTIKKMDGFYMARTCLTLEMAYNNARLLVKPETAWINAVVKDIE